MKIKCPQVVLVWHIKPGDSSQGVLLFISTRGHICFSRREPRAVDCGIERPGLH